MKILIRFVLIFFLSFQAVALQLHELIFFGDSLTDNGNLYRDTIDTIPPSPPYYAGRFTNGPTWAENVGNYYQKMSAIPYSIYAWAGATSAFHFPTRNFTAPISLYGEVKLYLLNSMFSDRSHNLYIIWIGDNDYLFFPDTDLNAVTNNSLASFKAAVETLINHGARYFLILNLTDASIAPARRNQAGAKYLHDLITLHNQKLIVLLNELKQTYPNVDLQSYDAYAFFNDYVKNYLKYNRLYHLNLTNNTNACLTINENQSTTPCPQSNSYIYWDSLHPTEPFHEVLSKLVIEKIYKTWLVGNLN